LKNSFCLPTGFTEQRFGCVLKMVETDSSFFCFVWTNLNQHL
jgi:hypothetical protein